MDLTVVLQQPFMQRALFGGLLIAILCAVIGIFITLRKQAFLSDAVAHASLSGVAVGLLISAEPLLPAMLVGVLMAVAITYLQNHSTISLDVLIGIFYSILFALGVIIINITPGYQPELFSYLFGSILAISPADLYISLAITLITIAFIAVLYRKLVYIIFDREAAFIRGINTTALEYLINILSSVTIIISIKIVGLILVTALLIIPATSAKLLAKNFKQMLPLSVIFSLVATVIGIICSYFLNTPTGATIVLISGILFLLIFTITRIFK